MSREEARSMVEVKSEGDSFSFTMLELGYIDSLQALHVNQDLLLSQNKRDSLGLNMAATCLASSTFLLS